MAIIEERPGWDEYFLTIAKQVATRSTCLRRKVGAVLTRGKRILATGYNGAPNRLEHCAKVGCLRQTLGIPSGERHEICRALHAEMNALLQAASPGVGITDSCLYCTTQPCALCAKMLINAGVKRVVWQEGYPDDFSLSLLREAQIELVHIPVESLDDGI